MSTFDITNPDTWPVLLNAREMGAIFRRASAGIIKSCQHGKFQPTPFQTRPYLWRKSDVVRFVESGRGSMRRAG